MRRRPADSLATAAAGTSSDAARPSARSTLRLVDSGGVGIPLDTWGTDYSHDRRAFRDAILTAGAVRRRICVSGESSVTGARTSNACVSTATTSSLIPLLLEFIDFDRVTSRNTSPGEAVYERDSHYRARHAAVRRAFAPLFDWTNEQGMEVFLEADMLALTPPLWRLSSRCRAGLKQNRGLMRPIPSCGRFIAPGSRSCSTKVPAIRGLVLRFGEGGSLYSSGDWPYRSEVAIRNAASLKAMLRGLLPVFEANHKRHSCSAAGRSASV